MRKDFVRLKDNLPKLLLLVFLVPFFYLLYEIYIPRVNAFGCFDDCFNFMGGYFLLSGKQIFFEFFYNHQPFAAYISYFVQWLAHPINVFELVLRHRQFVMLFAFLFHILLIWRFGLVAFLFALIYELSKFYLFGDRFLAEAIIVYPIAYLAGVAFFKFSNKKLSLVDYFLVPIFTWFVVFMREPYVPMSLFLFGIILFEKKIRRLQIISLFVFVLLSGITLLLIDFQEYFFNVVTVNYQALLPTSVKAEMLGNRYAQSLFYPLYIFFYGKWNILRQLLIFVDIVFLINLVVFMRSKSNYRIVLLIIVVLTLANIRVVLPGTMFYEAFHMLVWYALFIFITIMLVFWNFKVRRLFYLSIIFLTFALISFVFSKSYFPRDNFDQHSELITNYGEVMQIGEVVRALSKPGDTLFLDASDDLIYWQAKMLSPYKYTWYTSVMPYFKKYTDARVDMFKNDPPDFYKEFGSCPKKADIGELYRLPDFVKDKYVRLYNLENPSCLFVRKEKLKEISNKQWGKAAESLYGLHKVKP